MCFLAATVELFFSLFFFQCGNFAVLVDVRILPQGSSKDTSWFSHHEKELVCNLKKKIILFTKIACIYVVIMSGFEYGYNFCNLLLNYFFIDLRVFPDRFIVCVSKLESNSSAWTCENGVLVCTKLFYKFFLVILYVKRTKPRKSSTSKPQISKDSKKVYLGSVDSQTGNRKNDCQTSLSPQSEVKCRSTGLLKDCINTAESNLELPVLELESYVNQKQPDDVSSQQKPHSVEWLKSSFLSENCPCSSESAALGPKQSQEVTKTEAQQKSCGAEEKLKHFKKVSSEGTPLIPSNTEMSKCNDDCSGLFLEEKTPLSSSLFSNKNMIKTVSDEESLALRKNLSRPLSVRNNIVRTSQNEPSATTEELPLMPSSCLELQPVSSEKLIQKRKKEVENGLKKLKLRRLKKS
uniref:SLX4 interacting protein n=1 Tax=Buteo japonicus TaxID=224669 RepID=A0A8C0AQU2_9AVES